MPLTTPSWNRLEEWLWRLEHIGTLVEIQENTSPFAPGRSDVRVAQVLPRRVGTRGDEEGQWWPPGAAS
jgi:hypothetical protein